MFLSLSLVLSRSFTSWHNPHFPSFNAPFPPASAQGLLAKAHRRIDRVHRRRRREGTFRQRVSVRGPAVSRSRKKPGDASLPPPPVILFPGHMKLRRRRKRPLQGEKHKGQAKHEPYEICTARLYTLSLTHTHLHKYLEHSFVPRACLSPVFAQTRKPGALDQSGAPSLKSRPAIVRSGLPG